MELFWYSVVLLLSFVIGIPIGFGLLFSAVFYVLFLSNLDPIILPQQMVRGLNVFTILATNFYILLGEYMSRSGVTSRLVDLSNAVVGHIRGGLAHVTIVTNMIMAGVSGAATADAAAVGSVMIPAMRKEGYSASYAAAINCAAATMGPIIPPSLTMVVLGSIGNVSVGRLFLGGAIPGVMVGLYLMVYSYFTARRRGYGGTMKRFSGMRLKRSFIAGTLPLLVPFVIIYGVVGGIFTPTESGAVAAIVVLFLGVLVYRELGWRGMREGIRNTIHLEGSILMILAGASTFGWILTLEGAPEAFGNYLLTLTKSPLVIFFIINGILLLLGCFVDTLAIVILTTPVFLPILTRLGYDPIHVGVVMVLNVTIGLSTPPLGLTMFVTSGLARISIDEFMKDMFPLYIPLLLGLLTIILFPQFVMFLPNLLMPIPGH